jgi:hypothetical protein
MDALNVFLSMLAVLLAGLIVYFQYYYRQKVSKDTRLLSLLRFVTLLGMLLLLINPGFVQTELEVIKPKLLLAVDNSESIAHSGSEKTVRQLVEDFESDEELQRRFEMNRFQFGERLSSDTSLGFNETQTNIYKGVEDLNLISNQSSSPIVLISDGHQTFGKSYAFMNSKNQIYPIVVGDTIARSDLEINLVNVNAYATFENKFPVEVYLNYRGEGSVETTFVVEKDKLIVHSEQVTFTENNKSLQLEFYLPAESIGMQLYNARIRPFEGEDNVNNNSFSFGVEVIDEKTKVAVIYDVVHPDLGMIKRSIESNQQREVSLVHSSEVSEIEEDVSIFILYQPGAGFAESFERLLKNERSYFIITGTHTSWGFLNKAQGVFSKEISGISENYFPVYRSDFKNFNTEDLGFDKFAPLRDYFGGIRFNTPYETLLGKSINGIESEDPLLAAFQEGINRRLVLFGEDIWKWRMNSFIATGSYEKFDQFFNSLIQYLHLSNIKKDMELLYEPVYHANDLIKIKLKNYDANLNPDLNANIVFQFKDSVEEIPFYVKGNLYETQLPGLKQGKYDFEVMNKDVNKEKKGSFMVVPFSLEQEKTGADKNSLEQLALNSKGQLFYQDQFQELKKYLLENPDFRPMEKENTKMISLIDWKWLLGLIVVSLSLEWLIRKYRGLT